MCLEKFLSCFSDIFDFSACHLQVQTCGSSGNDIMGVLDSVVFSELFSYCFVNSFYVFMFVHIAY